MADTCPRSELEATTALLCLISPELVNQWGGVGLLPEVTSP